MKHEFVGPCGCQVVVHKSDTTHNGSLRSIGAPGKIFEDTTVKIIPSSLSTYSFHQIFIFYLYEITGSHSEILVINALGDLAGFKNVALYWSIANHKTWNISYFISCRAKQDIRAQLFLKRHGHVGGTWAFMCGEVILGHLVYFSKMDLQVLNR